MVEHFLSMSGDDVAVSDLLDLQKIIDTLIKRRFALDSDGDVLVSATVINHTQESMPFGCIPHHYLNMTGYTATVGMNLETAARMAAWALAETARRTIDA